MYRDSWSCLLYTSSGYLSCLSGIQRTGFPEETAWLAEQLNRPEFRQTLAEEYAAFWTAYQQNRELLRFHYHKPREIWENLKELSLPRRIFSSDLSQVPTVQHFITEDEIDTCLLYTSMADKAAAEQLKEACQGANVTIKKVERKEKSEKPLVHNTAGS